MPRQPHLQVICNMSWSVNKNDISNGRLMSTPYTHNCTNSDLRMNTYHFVYCKRTCNLHVELYKPIYYILSYNLYNIIIILSISCRNKLYFSDIIEILSRMIIYWYILFIPLYFWLLYCVCEMYSGFVLLSWWNLM